jgi:hypothetical protein
MGDLIGAILQPVVEAVCGVTAIYAMPIISFGWVGFAWSPPRNPKAIVLADDWATLIGLAMWASAIATFFLARCWLLQN